ncbi:MAG: pilus assembly protein [Alphaproteobacteria bacterium]|nr:pilus assembly protein [Alphaproteobacteria bacterium]
MLKTIKAYLLNTKGASAVEFALLAPILITLLVGTIDYGYYIVQRMELQSVATSVAEYVMIKQNDDNLVTVAGEVYSGNPLDITVTSSYQCQCEGGAPAACPLSCPGDDYQRRYVVVTVSQMHNILFPYPGFDSSVNLQSTARMRVD